MKRHFDMRTPTLFASCKRMRLTLFLARTIVLPSTSRCAGRAAHALDESVKRDWLLDDADSGFMPRGATTRWGSLGRPPLPIYEGSVEAVLLWGHGPPWASRQLCEFEENNMPPASAPASGLDRDEWIHDVREYYRCVRRLAEALMPVYAVALKMKPDYFESGHYFDVPCWCIRMNSYKPTAADGADPTVGIAPHADGSLITLLLTDDQPGLSVQRANGEWLHISSLPEGEREFSVRSTACTRICVRSYERTRSNGFESETWWLTGLTCRDCYYYYYYYYLLDCLLCFGTCLR